MEHQAEFRISPRQIVLVQKLLRENNQLLLTQEGRKELKWILAPILCHDAQQQQQFYDIYDAYLKNDLKYSREHRARIKREIDIRNTKNGEGRIIGKRNWEKWMPFLIILGCIGIFIVDYLYKESLPAPVNLKFHTKNKTVRVGDVISSKDFLKSITPKSADDKLVEMDTVWHLKKEGELIDSLGKFDRWEVIHHPLDSNYNRQIHLQIFDKETPQNLLGENDAQILIKCNQPPKPNGGIKIDTANIYKPGSILIFWVELPDTTGWEFYWTINEKRNDSLVGNLKLTTSFSSSGEQNLAFHIEPRNPVAGKCDTILRKTIKIEKEEITKLNLPSFSPVEDNNFETYEVLNPDWKWWMLYLTLGLLALSGLLKYLEIIDRKRLKEQKAKEKKLEKENNKENLDALFKPQDDSPFFIPFQNNNERIDPKKEQVSLANAMRQREEGTRKNLDVRNTIKATINNGGFSEIKYVSSTKPIDYVVLLDLQSVDSHQASLFKYLIKMLGDQDVYMEIYFYQKDFSKLWNNSHQKGLSLQQVSRLHHHQRLIVMGDAHVLVDDADDEDLLIDHQEKNFRNWKERILLTPLPVSSWTYKEARLYSLFPVFPSDIKGLIEAAKFIDAGMEYQDLPNTLGKWEEKLDDRDSEYESTVNRRWRTLAKHKEYLKEHPEVFRWLKALAVYPDPTWNVTIAIGKEIGVDVNFDNLLLLSRIPWLQNGDLPTRLWREILEDDEFFRDLEIDARKAVINELNAAKTSTTSFANHHKEINLAVQNFAIEPDKEENIELIAYLQENGLLPNINKEELDRTVELRVKGFKKIAGDTGRGELLKKYLLSKEEIDDPKGENGWHIFQVLSFIAGLMALIAALIGWYTDAQNDSLFSDKITPPAVQYNNKAVALFEKDSTTHKKASKAKTLTESSLSSLSIGKAQMMLDSAIVLDSSYLLAKINKQKLNYQTGLFNYFVVMDLPEKDIASYVDKAISNFSLLTETDSLYLFAQMGIASVQKLIKEDSLACKTIEGILEKDFTFFDTQPVPNVFTETNCNTEPQKYHIRVTVLEQGSKEPIQGATITLPNRLKLISDAKGQIDTTFERKLFSSNQITVSVEKENYQINNTQFSIFGSTSNNRNTIYLIQKPELDSDGDGVPDNKDLCPEEGGQVNQYGCLFFDFSDENQIAVIFDEALEKWASIQSKTYRKEQWIDQVDSLDFSNVGLIKIPKNVFKCKNLNTLILYENQLKSLPKEIGQLKKLKLLDLFNNELISLPEEIGQLNSLVNLDLRGNKFSKQEIEKIKRLLPNCNIFVEDQGYENNPSLIFSQATAEYQKLGLPIEQWILQIDSLNLSNQELTQIPVEVFECKNLKKLYLDFNQINILPEPIGRLQQLEVLELSINNLNEIPESIGKLKNLKTLGLSRNEIGTLPESTGDLESLTYLGLKDNNISREVIDRLRRQLPDCKIDADFDEIVEAKNTEPITPSMKSIGGGKFKMGCTTEQKKYCEEDESPSFNTSVDDFEIGIYEVTNDEYVRFLNDVGNKKINGNSYISLGGFHQNEKCRINEVRRGVFGIEKGYENHPVIFVSWDGVLAYTKWLSDKLNKDFDLPSEVEWEYVARKGNKSTKWLYAGSSNINDVGWFGGNSGGQTNQIGTKRPNSLGIYDLSGNVYEWTKNDYNEYPISVNDEYTNSNRRVLRGGSWTSRTSSCRVTDRLNNDKNIGYWNCGFRLIHRKRNRDPKKLPLPAMIPVPGGTFTMGCTDEQGEDCSDNEKPAHQVTLSDFSIGKYEVTNEEFVAFMNEKGNEEEGYSDWVKINGESINGERCRIIEEKPGKFSVDKGYEKHPMIFVSWYGARAYCLWLSEKTGKKYRLPTEAEWEYTARSGKNGKPTKFAGSDDVNEVAWHYTSIIKNDSKIKKVGTKKSNELGIYDLSGNVYEWCADRYDSEYYKIVKNGITNPSVPEKGDTRVLRGGSFYTSNRSCRVSFRNHSDPVSQSYQYGFRVAQD